jgi:hypothetical protein
MVEEPLMLSVEFLERVVGKDRGARLFGDPQQKGVTSSDGARRRRNHLASRFGFFESRHLRSVDAVSKGRIHNNRDVVLRVLSEKLPDCLVELGQAGKRTAFRGDIRTVDDDVADGHLGA